MGLPASGLKGGRRHRVWRPKSWLGMAVSNRLYEWRWFISDRVHRMLGREMTWPPHKIREPHDPTSDGTPEQ